MICENEIKLARNLLARFVRRNASNGCALPIKAVFDSLANLILGWHMYKLLHYIIKLRSTIKRMSDSWTISHLTIFRLELSQPSNKSRKMVTNVLPKNHGCRRWVKFLKSSFFSSQCVFHKETLMLFKLRKFVQILVQQRIISIIGNCQPATKFLRKKKTSTSSPLHSKVHLSSFSFAALLLSSLFLYFRTSLEHC